MALRIVMFLCLALAAVLCGCVQYEDKIDYKNDKVDGITEDPAIQPP
jgi:hypothetical protein